MDKTFEAPSGRFLPTVLVFVFVLALLYTLFLVFEKMSLIGSISAIAENTAELQGKIDALKEDKIAELYAAQQLKTELSTSTIYWSKVLTDFNKLTPVGVFLSSYGVSDSKSIEVSGLADSMGSVADFISALAKSDVFEGEFVPSVTAGTTSDGQGVVSFNLTANLSSSK